MYKFTYIILVERLGSTAMSAVGKEISRCSLSVCYQSVIMPNLIFLKFNNDLL